MQENSGRGDSKTKGRESRRTMMWNAERIEILNKARSIIQKLAEHFNVPLCDVRTNQRLWFLRGRYRRHPTYGTHPRIILSVRAFTVDILLHEFAHHLQYCSTPKGVDPFGPSGTCRDPHGREFFDELLSVTAFYYGDPALYDWEKTEASNKQLIAWWQQARREGVEIEAKIYPRAESQLNFGFEKAAQAGK
jgi:hypothetical protein